MIKELRSELDDFIDNATSEESSFMITVLQKRGWIPKRTALSGQLVSIAEAFGEAIDEEICYIRVPLEHWYAIQGHLAWLKATTKVA